MKLPNCLTALRGLPPFVVMILLVARLERVPATRAEHQEPIAANEIPTPLKSHQAGGARANFSQFSRDVTELRLSPDLRAIKLRWNYKHSDENRPESFRIRYCELTSWMAEIKCRQREMPVRPGTLAHADHSPLEAPKANGASGRPSPANGSDSTVITTMASVHSIGPQLYETQIFDLRALTNYTFHVEVARFAGEPAERELKALQLITSGARQRPSRRLDLTRDQNGLTATTSNAISADSVKLAQIETTKPFSAEAVKCLADSSEVLVNTGRYFGGRISVEGQPNARCQLMGNRSSEQSIYLFHIDHQTCRSKVMEGNRIETMILVHENKDILTHNTARFLVQCNIGQESFTVKASISLPKVINSLGGANGQSALSRTRPATITPLGSKPPPGFAAADAELQNRSDRVHLGSMPGVYRLIRADSERANAPQALIKPPETTTSNYLADGAPTTTSATIAADRPPASRSQRQSKGLTASDLLLALPKPVDVSSRILFVERAGEAAVAEAGQREPRFMASQTPFPAASKSRKHQSADHSNEKQDQHQQQPQKQKLMNQRENSSSKLTLSNGDGELTKEHDDVGEPVIMTNNHRVVGDFFSLDQHLSSGLGQRARASSLQDGPTDFSIKYSANKVDGFSLSKLQARQEFESTSKQTSEQTRRSRSGRMRHIDASSSTMSTPLASIESRMGDVAQTTPHHDTLDAEASNLGEQIAKLAPANAPNLTVNGPDATIAPQTTLAHNITGAIIRWSLKTLGNLARKSLESLAMDEQQSDLEARNRGGEAHLSTGPLTTRAIVPAPATTSMTRLAPLAPSQKPAPKVTSTTSRQTSIDEKPEVSEGVDGFVVNSRPVEATSTSLPPAKPAAPSRQQPSRADAVQNLHKSLDSGDQPRRARHQQQESEMRQTQSILKQRTTAAKSPVEKLKSAEVNHSEQAASDSYSKENSRSLWPLYGLWALCGLILLIMAAIYFVLMWPKHRASFPSHTIGSLRHKHNHDCGRQKPTGHLVARLEEAFHRQVAMAPASSNSSAATSSYHPHAPPTAQVNGNGITGMRPKTLASSSSSNGSTGTRSTSAASSALSSPSGAAREHYCKDQEQYVIYTDYLVLTDDNSSLADDHECLTRSGRRRRLPSESFA